MAKGGQGKKHGATFTALWAVRDAVGCFSVSERATLYGLVACMNAHGEASPGNSGVAAASSVDERHVRRTLDALIERGIVVVIKPHTPRTAAVYQISIPRLLDATRAASERRKSAETLPSKDEEGGHHAPTGGTPCPPGGGDMSPVEGAIGPPREDTMPPFEDLEDEEDKEDPRGAHAPVAGGAPPAGGPDGTFTLAPVDPKRTKKNRTKDPKEKRMSNAERFRGYAASFRSGYSRGAGRDLTVEAITRPEHPLVQALNTFARDGAGKKLEGEAVLAWLEERAEAFGKACGAVQFPYHRFSDWLNGITRGGRDTGTQPAAKTTASSWRAGVPEDEKQRLEDVAAKKGIDL